MKIILFIVLNYDFAFSFSFSSIIYLYYIFKLIYIFIFVLSLGVWNPRLTNPRVSDRPQLWLVIPHVTVNYFQKKDPSQI